MRLFFDTNVLLDYLLSRAPFADPAEHLIRACREMRIEGCMAAHSILNMFYILRKAFSLSERRELLLMLCRLLEVEGLDQQSIIVALQNRDFIDFEDCLQAGCAEHFSADYIVTRNAKDFQMSMIPCLNPTEAAAMILGGEGTGEKFKFNGGVMT